MIAKCWVVYLLRCADSSFYCGISNNLPNRIMIHNSGKGAKYTRSRRPVALVGVSPEMTKSEALKLEHRIKKLPAGQKTIKLLGRENRMTAKQDLKALQKEFNALGKKMEKLTKAVEKTEKAQASAAKAKAAKKTSAKKKAPTKKKAAAAKSKTVKTKKPAAKKSQ